MSSDEPGIMAPVIPEVYCTCGKRMYWCGVHESFVDTRHRSSHDDGAGHRIRHNTRGTKP